MRLAQYLGKDYEEVKRQIMEGRNLRQQQAKPAASKKAGSKKKGK